MYIKFLGKKADWREVADAARTTVNMEAGDKEPSSSWKRKILMAEHSPIRKIIFDWKWCNIMTWVSDHFVRHKYGIEHFVSTQRSDRTGIDRNLLPQNEPRNHEVEANAQAIINISRKRLCLGNVAKETRETWETFLNEIVAKEEPELYGVCVKECVYRGFCPEMKCCGYVKSEKFKEELDKYRNGFYQYEN